MRFARLGCAALATAVLGVAACGGSGAGTDASPTGSSPSSARDASAPLSDANADANDNADVSRGSDASAPANDAGIGPSDAAPMDAGPGTFLSRMYMGRTYKLYVPGSYRAGTPMPLFLMLHGCAQNPDDFATGTQMNAYADAHGVLVAYPEEPASANALECWNWPETADQIRSTGEPALLAGMVSDVESAYTVDAARVYAAGISAGAAMSVILGATYPDVFAAIAVHSGLEYAAASNTLAGVTATSTGGPDPKTQGDAAFAEMGTFARVVPVMVIHGNADTTVNVVNGLQVIAQWTETDQRAAGATGGVSATPTQTQQGSAGGKTFTHSTYTDATSHATVLELYIVDGMTHAWAGGNAAGSFTDPNAPNTTAIIGAFFAQHTH